MTRTAAVQNIAKTKAARPIMDSTIAQPFVQ
jgi:hypothetical protein